ncbi:MAG TPA: arylesterase [Dokdonella sp.]|uniref:arylesterase n=1 Tax=Dokdonella sp. TaxID=2291710 RepID=UPI002D7FB05E|nr:arylesterase [Dokdonella sp.]HET9032410.1 arylesterase [Dokdonella sp.]
MFRIFLVILLVSLQVPVARADVSTAPILILGDSLSAAYRIPPQSGWVNLLQKRLQSAHPARSVVNASISGETTAGGLARINELLVEHKPGIVVVELGANDALRGLPLATPRENLARIISLVQKADARVLLIGIEIPINYGPQYRDGLRDMYRDLGAEFNVPLVPFLLEGVALDDNLMQADGLHPTAAAQPRVLENVWPELEKLAGKRGVASGE